MEKGRLKMETAFLHDGFKQIIFSGSKIKIKKEQFGILWEKFQKAFQSRFLCLLNLVGLTSLC